MENFKTNTDFQLKSVKITSNNGGDPFEIQQLINTFSYVESVTNPFLSATMQVVDSGGLLTQLPIQGGEKVEISVLTTFSEESYDYEMVLWTVGNRFTQQQKQVYTLGLISAEALINEVTRITKPLSGNPESIVKDLLQNTLKTEKTIFAEPSKFEIKMTPNRKRPFDLITDLLRKAVPVQASYTSNNTDNTGTTEQQIKGTGGFFFWETYRGYNFFGVDSLCAAEDSKLKSKKLDSPSWGPYVERLGNQDDGGDDRFAIYSANFSSEINLMKSLRRGKYSSLMVFFNHSTGQYEEYVYKVKDSYDNMAHLGGQESISLIPTNQIELSDYPSRIMSVLLDHESWYNDPGIANPEDPKAKDPTKFADWQKYYAAQSTARAELLKNQEAVVQIPGNPQICAGDKIDLILVSKLSDALRAKEPIDKESSGVYLINEATHTFNFLEGANGTVKTTLRLFRDSYGLADGSSNRGTK